MSKLASTSQKSAKSIDTKDMTEIPKGQKKRRVSTQGSEKADDGLRAKPKKVMHAYLCYVTQNVKTVKTEEMAYKDAVRKCAENWNQLSAEGKVPYAAIAQEDTKRYEKEMKEYNETGYFTDKNGVHSSKIHVKKKKAKMVSVGAGKVKVQPTVLLPKKACVPFMFLVKERSGKIIKENNFKSAAAAIKVLGELWKIMSEEEKKPYVDQSAEDGKRRQRQLDELEKHGYFTTVDGKKSTDLPLKVKKGKRGPQVATQLGKRSSSEKSKPVPKTKPSNKHRVKVVMNPAKEDAELEDSDEEEDGELEGGSADDSSSDSEQSEEIDQEITAQKSVQKRQKVE